MRRRVSIERGRVHDDLIYQRQWPRSVARPLPFHGTRHHVQQDNQVDALGPSPPHARDRRDRPAGRGRSVRQARRYGGAGHGAGGEDAKPGQDFFPLTVDYQEKTYAAGKIPGGFFKREGRPSEKETLTSRLIDRPIRPLFPEGFFNEVQVIATVLSVDPEIDPDVPAMIGASAALMLSGVPFQGPIGAARVGYIDGQYV